MPSRFYEYLVEEEIERVADAYCAGKLVAFGVAEAQGEMPLVTIKPVVHVDKVVMTVRRD